MISTKVKNLYVLTLALNGLNAHYVNQLTERMSAYTIFSCKGLAAKQSIALQILGYTTISIIAEKFEQEPQADIQIFIKSEQKQLNNFVESVNICPELWELVKDSAPDSEIFFAKILEMDGVILSQCDFDNAMNEIQALLNESEVPFRIIDELFTHETLSEERLNILKTIIENETKQPQQSKQRQGRSKTFRANGRRALTPMRRRRKIPDTPK